MTPLVNLTVVPQVSTEWFEPEPAHPVTRPATAQQQTLFEGEVVRDVRGKLIGAGNLELDAPHRIDDLVRVMVTARVVRVDHTVDERTGHLHRVETFRIIDVHEIPDNLGDGS